MAQLKITVYVLTYEEYQIPERVVGVTADLKAAQDFAALPTKSTHELRQFYLHYIEVPTDFMTDGATCGHFRGSVGGAVALALCKVCERLLTMRTEDVPKIRDGKDADDKALRHWMQRGAQGVRSMRDFAAFISDLLERRPDLESVLRPAESPSDCPQKGEGN